MTVLIFKVSLALLALLSGPCRTLGHPSPMTHQVRDDKTPTPGQGRNECGGSVFVNQVSPGSPSTLDCLQLAANVDGTDGVWPIQQFKSSQHQLAQYNSCAFGVQIVRSNEAFFTNIGAQDVADLIHDSVKFFEWDGKVGTAGITKCKSTDMAWAIYYNPDWKT